MTADDNQVGVALSLLDRLIDLEPDSRREARSNPWDEMRNLKVSLCRDLTALLNTRRAEEDFPGGYEESTNSLLSFGVVDFTAHDLRNGVEQERLRRSIERAVRQFEPRLASVTVSIEEPDPLRPVLQFQITAMLRIQPASESVVFDVTLQRETRRMAVSGGHS
jgi:type VI secretion system protein ImpF